MKKYVVVLVSILFTLSGAVSNAQNQGLSGLKCKMALTRLGVESSEDHWNNPFGSFYETYIKFKNKNSYDTSYYADIGLSNDRLGKLYARVILRHGLYPATTVFHEYFDAPESGHFYHRILTIIPTKYNGFLTKAEFACSL